MHSASHDLEGQFYSLSSCLHEWRYEVLFISSLKQISLALVILACVFIVPLLSLY